MGGKDAGKGTEVKETVGKDKEYKVPGRSRQIESHVNICNTWTAFKIPTYFLTTSVRRQNFL